MGIIHYGIRMPAADEAAKRDKNRPRRYFRDRGFPIIGMVGELWKKQEDLVDATPFMLEAFPNLTVARNIFAGREVTRAWGRLDESAMRARTRDLLAQLHVPVTPETPMDQLSTAHAQLVQVARAMSFDCHILVLDEPTTSLTQPACRRRRLHPPRDVGAGRDRPRCEIVMLHSGGTPVAGGIVVRPQDRAFFFKIGIDERFAKHSPGAQLTLELTRYLCADRAINSADSTAAPGHPMIDPIWRSASRSATCCCRCGGAIRWSPPSMSR